MVELLDALPDAVCIVDKLGLIVQANSYFCKNIAKAERTVGISLLEDLIHQTDRDKLGIAVRQASSTGDRVVIGRCRTMTFEGANEFPVFRQYEWVVSGGVEPGTVIASGRLVGAKERIVQEVEQEEELLDFFQNAPIALHWLSDKGIIIWANNTELQTLGYSAEEYIGQPVMKFCPDEEELVLEIFKQLGTGNTIKDVPVRFRTKNGDIRYLLIDSNVNYNVDGSFRHTRCFIRDDTSRIVREAVVKYEKEQADSKSRQKDAFFKNLFLELQSPNREPSPTGALYDADFVQTIMEYMQYTSHIENRKVLKLVPSNIDLVTNLNELVRVNKEKFKHIDFQVRSHDIAKFVSVDSCLFKHVLQPLLNFIVMNAPSGTTADVCVFHAVQYYTFKIEFQMQREVSSDTLFKNFHHYYANNELPGFASIGLGIYIASNLIQSMGGSLEYYAEGCDAVFQFNLPLKVISSAPEVEAPRGELRWSSIAESAVAAIHIVDESRPSSARTSTTDATDLEEIQFTMSAEELAMSVKMKQMMLGSVSGGEVKVAGAESFVETARRGCENHDFLGLSKGRQLRILIVDDSSICTTMLCKCLEKVGYATEAANNGKEALRLLSMSPYVFDAVVMDIVMPIMNGIEATKAIRKNLKLPNLPIIVLTADVSEETRKDAMAAGATDYMLKPAHTKDIIHLLHSRGLFAQVPDKN